MARLFGTIPGCLAETFAIAGQPGRVIGATIGATGRDAWIGKAEAELDEPGGINGRAQAWCLHFREG